MAEPDSRYRRRGREIQYYNDDGLMEICLGAGILLAGLTVSPESPAAILWLLLAVVAIALLKKLIAEPRLEGSNVDLSRERQAEVETRYSTRAVTLVAVAVMFLLYELLAVSKSDLSAHYRQQPWFLAVIAVGPCFGAGYQYRAPRLVAYGALSAILFIISFFTGLSFKAIAIFTGLLIILTGGIYLFRFLQSYPASGGD